MLCHQHEPENVRLVRDWSPMRGSLYMNVHVTHITLLVRLAGMEQQVTYFWCGLIAFVFGASRYLSSVFGIDLSGVSEGGKERHGLKTT